MDEGTATVVATPIVLHSTIGSRWLPTVNIKVVHIDIAQAVWHELITILGSSRLVSHEVRNMIIIRMWWQLITGMTFQYTELTT